MLRILGGITGLLGELFELQHWLEEWRTRHSPAAFWLAVFVGLGIVAVILLYLSDGWESVRAHFG